MLPKGDVMKVEMNYGKLINSVEPSQNIVYFRRGEDELSLNITNRCPNSCPFCIRDRNIGWGVSNLYLNEEPELNDIINEFAYYFNSLIKKVKICGYGEPMMRLDILPDLVKYLKSYGVPDIQLTTTGWPMYFVDNGIELFKKSVENGINKIYLSLHGVDVKTYKKLVNPHIDAGVAFNRTIDFLDICSKLELDITLSFIGIGKIDIDKVHEISKKYKCNYHIRDYEL